MSVENQFQHKHTMRPSEALALYHKRKFQFERHGYFVADHVDHAAGRLVGLKVSWGK